MTKLTYVITRNGHEIKSATYSTYKQVKEAVEQLGPKYSFKAVYTKIDPNDTPAAAEIAEKHRRKLEEYKKAHTK